MPSHTDSPRSTAHSCIRVQPLLDAFHDGALDTAQHARVSRHLGHCDTCAAVVAGLAALRQALRAPVDAELAQAPAAQMWDRVAAELDRQETVRVRTADLAGVRAKWLWTAFARPALAVATAAVLVVVALVAQPKTSQPVNVARDTFTIDEIETTAAGVLVYESEDTDMTIIWIIEDDATDATPTDRVAL